MDSTLRNILTVSTILFAVIDVVGSIQSYFPFDRKLERFIWKSNTRFIADHGWVPVCRAKYPGFLGVDVSSFAIAGSLVLFFSCTWNDSWN